MNPTGDYGFIVRVATRDGDYWLGQRVYTTYDAALCVKHNLIDTKRYQRVYIQLATKEQAEVALGIYNAAEWPEAQ